jgi:hypothetical protein
VAVASDEADAAATTTKAETKAAVAVAARAEAAKTTKAETLAATAATAEAAVAAPIAKARVTAATATVEADAVAAAVATNTKATETAARAAQAAKAVAKARRGTAGPINPALDEDQHQDLVDWELADEEGLPEGSTLSGNKALMDNYPKDEASSKKTQKTNTGKEKKGNAKHKK